MHTDMIKNYFNSLITYGTNGFQNVQDNIYKKRLDICQSCEKYNKEENKCGVCGCKMAGTSGFVSKLRMAHERCL